MKKFLFLPVLFLMVVLLITCKKENKEIDLNPNLAATDNNVRAEFVFKDVFNYLFKITNDTVVLNTGYAQIDGAQIYYITYPSPRFTVKFGDYYVICPDGLARKGAYFADVTGGFNDPGTIASVTFDDYCLHDMKIEAKETITNQGRDNNNQLYFQYLADSVTITILDTVNPVKFSWKCNKAATWIQGENTPYDNSDDVFLINGTSQGVSTFGNSFITEITDPLGDAFSCIWINSGTQNISIPGLDVSSGIIDYILQDNCNNMVNYYFNGDLFYYKYFSNAY